MNQPTYSIRKVTAAGTEVSPDQSAASPCDKCMNQLCYITDNSNVCAAGIASCRIRNPHSHLPKWELSEQNPGLEYSWLQQRILTNPAAAYKDGLKLPDSLTQVYTMTRAQLRDHGTEEEKQQVAEALGCRAALERLAVHVPRAASATVAVGNGPMHGSACQDWPRAI